ncbi:hypothetical protein [Tsukamurella tyrosinosolvens]|uniref:hypothetical protein n=1 Tax=Tsukamurella tyrosinosolvens TaxID=57704 RepID=UPI003F49B9D6
MTAPPPGVSSGRARTRAGDPPRRLTPEQEAIVREVARAGGRQAVAARRAGVERWRVSAWCKETGNPWARLKMAAKVEAVDDRLQQAMAKLSPAARARIQDRCNHRATSKFSTSKNTTSSGH